ncbi:MAG: hypothetical protein ACE5F1_09040 [Planctomycetota bacterium]
MRSYLSVLALFLLSAPVKADEDRMLRVEIEPGRGQWVTSPVNLQLGFSDVSPLTLAWVDLSSIRFRIDGLDVSEGILVLARKSGRIELGENALRISLPLPFAPGEHRVEVSYRVPSGGGPVFRQSFRVYDPEKIRRALAVKAGKGGGSLKPLQVDYVAVRPTAPPVFLTPADKSFVKTLKPDLRVSWFKGQVGFLPSSVRILLDNTDITASFKRSLREALSPGYTISPGRHTLVAQVLDESGNLRVASSTFVVFDANAGYSWFYGSTATHVIGHTHHQLQNYGIGSSGAYFHHGIDVHSGFPPKLSPAVYASAGGRITNFYWYGRQPYYFEVEVTDQYGFRWQYHHVDRNSIPSNIVTIANQRGTIPAGILIGASVRWPVRSYGYYFHHIHLNVYGPDGLYVNPIHMLKPLADTKSPTVQQIYITQNNSSTVLNRGGVSGATVGGKLDFVSRAQDLIGSYPYQLTIYRMTWELTELGGSRSHHVPETELWTFDRLPGGASRFTNVWDIFRYRLYDFGTLQSKGDYTSRIFYYSVTNRIGATVSNSLGFFDSAARAADNTLEYPNGLYRLTVRAYDVRGNVGSGSITMNLRN